MKLLDALVAAARAKPMGITHARMVHFAIADDKDVAFLSEIELEELVPVIEEWCRQRRAEMVVN